MNPTVARVAVYSGIPVDVFMGRSRVARVAYFRQIAMYLLYTTKGLTLRSTGEELDRNTHTVWHGVHRIEARLRAGDTETLHDVAMLSKED